MKLPRITISVLVVVGLILLVPSVFYALLVLGTRRSVHYYYGA